jgi:hypothetical protein
MATARQQVHAAGPVARRTRDVPRASTVAVDARIDELRAEARYARERFDLYRAKMYGPRPTTMTRLRELERIHESADARLRRAQNAKPPLSSS